MQQKDAELVSYEVKQKPEVAKPVKSPVVRAKTTYVARNTPQILEETVVSQAVPTAPRTTRTTYRPAAPAEPTRTEEPPDDFPKFDRAIYPVSKAPNWGAMQSEQEWERIYAEMTSNDFVAIPSYDLSKLTVPMRDLTRDRTTENNAIITSKLFYSTRFFGAYDLDSNEYQGRHAGIDFKLAAGTPIGAVAGGVVHATGNNDDIGNYVMVLHRLPGTNEEVVSIYGHLDSVTVVEGRAVAPGTIIGYAGSTGKSNSPHLHLQIDYKKNPGRHSLYVPGSDVSASETSKWTIHPIEFIAKW